MSQKAISTELTESNVQQILKILGESAYRLEALAEGLNAEQLREPLGGGERSLTEALAHLLHCEARSSEAIYLALLADEPEFADIQPERQYGTLLRYDRLDFPELMEYFKLRRLLLLRVICPLKEPQWKRAVRPTGKKRKESVYLQARSMALHELEHVEDLERRRTDLTRGE